MLLRWLVIVIVLSCSSPARRSEPVGNVASTGSVNPATVVVQLAYRGTFMIGPPFSQIPPFTLLADGTLITVKDDVLLDETKLSRDEADRIVRHVRDLGFDRLETRTDECKRNPDGTGLCISDAAYTILRVVSPAGKLREVTTYADFSNEPAIHEKVVAYLTGYKPARSTPYRPTFGVLHVHADEAVPKPSCPAIDAAVLRREKDKTVWALPIEGAAVESVLAIAPGYVRRFAACANGVQYQLMFMPGVPGSDLSEELAPYKARE